MGVLFRLELGLCMGSSPIRVLSCPPLRKSNERRIVCAPLQGLFFYFF